MRTGAQKVLFFKDFRPQKDGSGNQMIPFPDAEMIVRFPVALGRG